MISGLVQIADDACGGILPIIKLIRQGVFPIIQIGIPIILIVMGSIDLGKAVLSSDEKAIKAAQGSLIKRCIAAVAVFFVVTIVTVLMSLIAKADVDTNTTTGKNWLDCWNEAAK